MQPLIGLVSVDSQSATHFFDASVQFSSVTQSFPTLCDPMNRSTPGLPVHHHLPYSAIKKNTFESVLMRWMKLEPIIQSEVSQKEKHQYSILMHIYGI